MKTRPVEVTIPTKAEAKPPLVQVALVVAACFALGVVWPRLAGVSLVPRAPGSDAAADAVSASVAPVSSPTSSPLASAAPLEGEPTAARVRTMVQDTTVINCRDGERRWSGEQCDKPDLESVAAPRLLALQTCPGVESAAGVLSVGLELDFAKGKVVEVLRGNSTTLGQELSRQLLRCVEREFSTATLEGISHQHQRYLYFYVVKLEPLGTPTNSEQGDGHGTTQASGVVTVIWESAQVRALPDPSAEVQTRLLYGTRVRVEARKGDWYRVQYDNKGSVGWLHKKAVGL